MPLIVLSDEFIQLIHDALLQVVQCKEDSRLFNSIRYSVCTQVLEELQVALFLFDLPNLSTSSSLYWNFILLMYSISNVVIMFYLFI